MFLSNSGNDDNLKLLSPLATGIQSKALGEGGDQRHSPRTKGSSCSTQQHMLMCPWVEFPNSWPLKRLDTGVTSESLMMLKSPRRWMLETIDVVFEEQFAFHFSSNATPYGVLLTGKLDTSLHGRLRMLGQERGKMSHNNEFVRLAWTPSAQGRFYATQIRQAVLIRRPCTPVRGTVLRDELATRQWCAARNSA